MIMRYTSEINKMNKARIIRRIILCLLLSFVLLARFLPVVGEWYAMACYPYISGVLSSFSSLFSFSVGDCFIIGGVLWITRYFIYALWKQGERKQRLFRLIEFAVWIYVWFYLAWGLNYFRMPFYERTEIPCVAYTPENFREFLSGYVDGLNGSYTELTAADSSFLQKKPGELFGDVSVEQDIFRIYHGIAPDFGLVSLQPGEVLRAKKMLLSRGISMVGVTGYMGPFFSEFNLNSGLLPVEYPFTYAHELAHRLSVAGEAEANFYAYLACTSSVMPEVRFSGYFSIFGYVMANARKLLDEEQYKSLYDSISPEIITLYKDHLDYWRSKYSPWIGKMQNSLYNFYLKGNQISSGTKNYSEVIGLLISYEYYKR